MNYKKQLLLLSLVPVLVILYGLYLDFVSGYVRFFSESMENFLSNFSLSLFVTLIPLYFLKEGVYKAWRKFALIYLPIVIFLIVISPEYADNFLGGPSYGADRESTTIVTAGLFVLISYILIIYKSFSLRSK